MNSDVKYRELRDAAAEEFNRYLRRQYMSEPVTIRSETIFSVGADWADKRWDHKKTEILEYCTSNIHERWAARISSILLDYDLRESKQMLNKNIGERK